MEGRLVIVGAGISGLIACKYAIEKGFNPIVFEAEEFIGGIWNHTIESTKLQNTRPSFQFSDFPWPSSVEQLHPRNTQVLEYIQSYAQHFGLYPYIRFNSKIISIDYVGEPFEDMESWDLWGGSGKPFDSKGKWHILVQDTKTCTTKVYQFEFVILCIGRFSGVPNIPKFPTNEGPEVFKGKVLHSMDYAAMDNTSAAELIRGKKVTIIGSQKSAVDIAAECANINGVTHPCTVLQRTTHWFVPSFDIWGVNLGYLYFNRLAELLIHKPGETFMLSLLATLLSPLRWAITKFTESYLKWTLPLKKYDMVPNTSFLQDISSCLIAILPENFYEKVEEGSIILKKSKGFSFYKEGLIINNGGTQALESDIVILATGYKGDEKLRNMFQSPIFQKLITGPPASIVPLYREIIHPQIPQVAVIGYAEGYSNLADSEIRCQWLAHFLSGNIQLPNIREMKKDVKKWEIYRRISAGKYFWRSCIGICNIWYNDQLCKDMGCNNRRKKGILAEFFQPYGPLDYVALTHN